ncbi:MAG: glycine cleavage system protein GcvH [Candidatus Dormibacteraceae bacterium]
MPEQPGADRRYSETHEWVSAAGGEATIGITDFAQAQLGDVVFLELPRVGARLSAGDAFGVIESVKAASDLYSPVSGTVVAVNEALSETPELVNRDPLGEGWLLRLELGGEPPSHLLDEAGYKKLTEGSSYPR